MKILIISVILLFIGGAYYIYDSNDSPEDYREYKTNYEGLFKLGLIPSADSRQPQEKDIDTGVTLTNGNDVYSLIESRTFETSDYGRTFLVKLN